MTENIAMGQAPKKPVFSAAQLFAEVPEVRV